MIAFVDPPVGRPCARHQAAGRDYDDGCYACSSQHEERLKAWVKFNLISTLEAIHSGGDYYGKTRSTPQA